MNPCRPSAIAQRRLDARGNHCDVLRPKRTHDCVRRLHGNQGRPAWRPASLTEPALTTRSGWLMFNVHLRAKDDVVVVAQRRRSALSTSNAFGRGWWLRTVRHELLDRTIVWTSANFAACSSATSTTTTVTCPTGRCTNSARRRRCRADRVRAPDRAPRHLRWAHPRAPTRRRTAATELRPSRRQRQRAQVTPTPVSEEQFSTPTGAARSSMSRDALRSVQ